MAGGRATCLSTATRRRKKRKKKKPPKSSSSRAVRTSPLPACSCSLSAWIPYSTRCWVQQWIHEHASDFEAFPKNFTQFTFVADFGTWALFYDHLVSGTHVLCLLLLRCTENWTFLGKRFPYFLCLVRQRIHSKRESRRPWKNFAYFPRENGPRIPWSLCPRTLFPRAPLIRQSPVRCLPRRVQEK